MDAQEIVEYGVMLLIVVIFTLGLFGAFDNDEDNPFKNSK